jgi:hypothetical protein
MMFTHVIAEVHLCLCPNARDVSNSSVKIIQACLRALNRNRHCRRRRRRCRHHLRKPRRPPSQRHLLVERLARRNSHTGDDSAMRSEYETPPSTSSCGRKGLQARK